MQYLLTIWGDEAAAEKMTSEESEAIINAYWTFTEAVKEAGVYVGGEALQPTNTATTVRVRNGQRQVTDGPFAETKEQLGGYYYLDCKDLDEALDWAAKIPGAEDGSIEVRPIIVFDDAPAPDGAASGAGAAS